MITISTLAKWNVAQSCVKKYLVDRHPFLVFFNFFSLSTLKRTSNYTMQMAAVDPSCIQMCCMTQRQQKLRLHVNDADERLCQSETLPSVVSVRKY